jgi:NADH:ubiquinone oxidoreductase subunit E
LRTGIRRGHHRHSTRTRSSSEPTARENRPRPSGRFRPFSYLPTMPGRRQHHGAAWSETSPPAFDAARRLLPILHAVQGALGYVSRRPSLCWRMNQPFGRTCTESPFYHDFRSEPAGRATAASAGGGVSGRRSGRLVATCGTHGGRSGRPADGSLTAEQVFCLGNCAGPQRGEWPLTAGWRFACR